MRTIRADFNAQTSDNRVRLSTRAAAASIASCPELKPGDWVWLSDGEVRVGAKLERAAADWVAVPAWESVQDVGEPEDVERADAAFDDLAREMGRDVQDHRRMLRLLPQAEHRLPDGLAEHVRSRALHALGYPELALDLVEAALSRDRRNPAFLWHWLDLLRQLDADRAASEAMRLDGDPLTAALVLAKCASVLQAHAAGADDIERRRAGYRRALEIGARFDKAPGRDLVPPEVAALLHSTCGYCHLALGDRDAGVAEFTQAIAIDPARAEPYVLRGVTTFPSTESLEDLRRAVERGYLYPWPAYYLAYYHAHEGQWTLVGHYGRLALRLGPNPVAAANVREWLAMAEAQVGNKERAMELIHQALEQALDHATESTRDRYRSHQQMIADYDPGAPAPRWTVQRDEQAPLLAIA